MPRRKQSKGICTYCGQTMTQSGLTKHLTTCTQRQEAIAKANQKKSASQKLYHLRVKDAYRSEFWLNLEMRGAKTLQDLDDYLRDIWLECCGHLSQFSTGRGLAAQISMKRKIDDVFQRSSELNHIYDFGTSSETQIKLVEVREGQPTTPHPIALMARNLLPEEPCIECGETATHLCMECVIDDQTWGVLCDRHAKTHPHDSYGDPVLLVNSPRLGMCGYDGPAEPPY